MAVAHLEWVPGGGVQQLVRYKLASDPTYTLYDTLTSSVDEIDITGLLDNRLYDFLIVNKCSVEQETLSDMMQGAWVTCPSLSVVQTALSLSVEFTELGGDIDLYTARCYELPGDTLVEEILYYATGSGPVSIEFSDLEPDTYHRIEVIPSIGGTFMNETCEIEERTLGCSEGYTLAPDGSYCYLIEETAADPPTGGTPENTVSSTHSSYGEFGTYIYDPGFNVNGTGVSTQVSPSNAFWINSGTTTDGPLNRCGLWTTSELSGQTIGFAVCLDLPETKVYYVGMGGDNRCRFTVDGVAVVDQNVSALSTQYGSDAQITFKVWHVYPVTLSAGPHIIELIGVNVSGDASLGAEIYNNTAGEIAAATSYVGTGLNLIFSTKDYIGQPVQLGSDDLGYTCPTGYSFAACEEPVVCRRILTELPS